MLFSVSQSRRPLPPGTDGTFEPLLSCDLRKNPVLLGFGNKRLAYEASASAQPPFCADCTVKNLPVPTISELKIGCKVGGCELR